MKQIFSFILVFLFSLIHFASAQTLEDAFSKSYALESQGKFADAITLLKKSYDENGYELNIRIGYLNEEAGQYSEAEKYYAKAVTLMPNSVEAKLGYVLPLSAEGNWTKVG